MARQDCFRQAPEVLINRLFGIIIVTVVKLKNRPFLSKFKTNTQKRSCLCEFLTKLSLKIKN